MMSNNVDSNTLPFENIDDTNHMCSFSLALSFGRLRNIVIRVFSLFTRKKRQKQIQHLVLSIESPL